LTEYYIYLTSAFGLSTLTGDFLIPLQRGGKKFISRMSEKGMPLKGKVGKMVSSEEANTGLELD